MHATSSNSAPLLTSTAAWSPRRSLIRGAAVALFAALTLLSTPEAFSATAQWEYRVENARLKNRQLEALLNTYAAGGWELIQITDNGVAIFKRKK